MTAAAKKRPPMRTIEIRSDPQIEERTFETFDEALAWALEDAPVGCVISVHDAECATDGEDEKTCTCSPLELVAGVEA